MSTPLYRFRAMSPVFLNSAIAMQKPVDGIVLVFFWMGRAVGNPGSFALFAKGGIPRISIPTVAYPTLCKERKGWGTRLFVVLPAVPNTDGSLIRVCFLFRVKGTGFTGCGKTRDRVGKTYLRG
jgi:hypothetical protein